jgi:hypothetical protein
MSEGPTYVYDVNSQFQEPIFVVYQRAHVEFVLTALGFSVDDVYITKHKLHPYDANRYRGQTGQIDVTLVKPKVLSTS